ncbi:hypothetical protein [Actinomadura harenae]|nr:hypothetical protein [Actinomadura harenae]
MDPLTALVVAMWIAGHFTKNVTQDLTWKARGEDPPSFRREQERRANGTNRRPFTERREARRFFVNAWEDAWENADAHRARRHEQHADRRRERWDLQDQVEGAEKDGHERNRALDAAEDAAYERNQQLRNCLRCGELRDVAELADIEVNGVLQPLCPPCVYAVTKPESTTQQFPKCWRCGRLTSAPRVYHWQGADRIVCRPCLRHLLQHNSVDVPLPGNNSTPGARFAKEPEADAEPGQASNPPRPGTSEFCPHCVAREGYNEQAQQAIIHEPHCPRNIRASRPETPAPQGVPADRASNRPWPGTSELCPHCVARQHVGPQGRSAIAHEPHCPRNIPAVRPKTPAPQGDSARNNTHQPVTSADAEPEPSREAKPTEPTSGADTSEKEADDPPVPGTSRTSDQNASEPESGEAQVIEFSTWRRDHPAADHGTTSTTSSAPLEGTTTAADAAGTTTEDSLSAESQTLNAAITFTNGMANSAGAALNNTELSLTGLRAGGVTGDALAALELAMEAMQQAQAAYQRANTVLVGHLSVREAYEANQGAGNREYVTQD